MDTGLPRLRADAQDNRDRVLAAARTLFAERGLGVGMREIARRAEVGPATLYRRFPTKQAVIDEAFDVELRACRRIVVAGCADPDAWRGLGTVVRALLALTAQNHGFVDAFAAATAAAPAAVPIGAPGAGAAAAAVDGPFAGHRRDLLRMLARLLARARADGTVRSDIAVDDLALVLLAGRGLVAVAAGSRAAAVARFATLAVDALRASPPTEREGGAER